ncbi:MAG: DUF2892 domain-containing protein [Vicinamibacterales bacterium]
MTTNEGGWDRGVRLAAGAGLLAMALAGPWWPWGLIGVVPLLTGLSGWCPLYSVLGVSTCPARRS